jgi:hypothetical protein
MPGNQPVSAKQLKKALNLFRKDLHKLATVLQKGFYRLDRRFGRLLAEEKRHYSVIELGGKKYRFLK